jgi:uncharacterized protein (TIGR00730 family)
MQRLGVFCGSRPGVQPVYADAARQLGALLAANKITLVFGGGHIGLMGILADAVLQAGGSAVGVIPKALVDRELAHTGLTELRVVSTMHERKAVIADLSDGFAALPGAFGTADELFEILTWAQLKIHSKPIGLLNTAGFFNSLLAWIDLAMREDFLKPAHRELLMEARDPGQLLAMLESFRPRALPEKGVERDAR